MFCHKCGKETVEDAAFCVYCGAKLVVPASAKSAVNEQSSVSEIENIDTAKSEAHIETTEKEIKTENAVDIDPLTAEEDEETEASGISPKKESKKAKEKKKSKRKLPSKNQSSIFIQANDERFKERNLIVYLNGVGYHLHELNKTAFCIEFDAKIVALLDAEQNGERIKSEELIIPKGKVVNIEIILTEDETLVAEIISEEDYEGSELEKKERQRRLKRKIIKIVIFLSLGIVFLISILISLNILPDKERAKNIAEKRILSEAQSLYGSNVEITKIKYNSIYTELFTDIKKYDFYSELSKTGFIDSNGKKYSSCLAYLRSRNIDAYTSTKRAYVLSGTCELLNDGESIKEKFQVVIVYHFPGNSWWTTKCKLGSSLDDTDNGSNSGNDIDYLSKSEAQNIVQGRLIEYCSTSKINGSQMYFINCTFATTESYGSGYKFYGKLTVKDAYGTIYVADYHATITNLTKEVDVKSFSEQ